MRNTNGRVVIYNAMNDFTERDKANAQYRLLIANKFKQDIQQLELQQANAFNICIRAAIRDLSVWMAVIVFMALVLYSVSW